MPDRALATTPRNESGPNRRQKPALRNILKDATAADHARLDARLGSFDLLEPGGYRRFLEANAAALLPLESALVKAGVRKVLPNWDRHARSRAILADLSTTGGTPDSLDVPVLSGRSAVLGTLYVLEGSRLGAAWLLKHIRRTSDPRILNATAYLAHGAGQRFWQDFLATLEDHADEVGDTNDLVDPARRAFDLFLKAAQR